MSDPTSATLTAMVNPASRNGVDAFIGQLILSPVPEEDVLTVLSALGHQVESLFPDLFQYGQAITVNMEDQPSHLGVMFILAPFEEEQPARDFMLGAVQTLTAAMAMEAQTSHVGTATPQ